MKSLHLKLKKLIRSKNNLKKETESLLKAKEAKKKQIQRNQERTVDESLLKPSCLVYFVGIPFFQLVTYFNN